MGIPKGEIRRINDMNVFAVTCSFSIFAYIWLLIVLMVWTPDRVTMVEGKYSSEGAAREWSTVVDISIPPPSFKSVSLSLSRSSLSKTPKQVLFFNPIKYILNIFYHTLLLYPVTWM